MRRAAARVVPDRDFLPAVRGADPGGVRRRAAGDGDGGPKMTYLPMTLGDWARYQRTAALLAATAGRIRSEGEIIKRNVNWLIANLYDPSGEVGARAGSRAALFDDEPINWGDLSCVMVEPPAEGQGWAVLIEEAAPGECPRFCAYIRDWLGKWGWPAVEVETEW